MVPITSLWLPILASAVFVFVVSSILHMVLKYHQTDYRELPDEAETLAALRKAGVTPGLYHFPYCPTPKEMGTEEMVAKFKQGPVGLMTVMPPGPMAMGKYLTMWFVYSVLVSFFTAYLCGHTLAAGAEYLTVSRVAGTVAFMAYGVGQLVDSVWKGAPWGNTLKNVFDGLVYALVTGGAFGWLWPS
jgi:hypothetical protein